MKKAIITGGTGFVGSNLSRELLRQGWEVSIIAQKKFGYKNIEDIRDKVNIFEYEGDIDQLINFFQNTNANVVFHLASVFISEHKSEEVDLLIDSNLKFGAQILEAMKKSKTKLIINTGTSWQHYHSDAYNPVCLYAATKEAFEKLIEYYIAGEGIRGITLKLFDTYSETDTRPKLINLLHKFSLEKTQLDMSPGDQVIDLVHVDDVVNAFIKAYEYISENKEIQYEKYAVSSGREVKLKELIELYEKVSGEKILVKWGGRTYRKREVMKLWRNFKTLPGWTCNISLEEGLKRVSHPNK
ncbi:NAD-dependent epimerase/dehydratase family protein [Ilyobacter polytropus]|uniref:NAD-dependent epimerase/dehydratase n=1 Tax=Ilyobacter polytropus (strain ATCC 51220 / DSM 2926 / LMG 16218 / CuHBu1) TaxID=572544 RepID=E3H7B4_ILYPC|nr:NAD-dependent epimerase/dehydratase family protein [Ilyobacter polytropus]ADO82595.1 NAD-dependent epimerase/dehydratase [Ilyobacter polytropus DSM 2926]